MIDRRSGFCFFSRSGVERILQRVARRQRQLCIRDGVKLAAKSTMKTSGNAMTETPFGKCEALSCRAKVNGSLMNLPRLSFQAVRRWFSPITVSSGPRSSSRRGQTTSTTAPLPAGGSPRSQPLSDPLANRSRAPDRSRKVLAINNPSPMPSYSGCGGSLAVPLPRRRRGSVSYSHLTLLTSCPVCISLVAW